MCVTGKVRTNVRRVRPTHVWVTVVDLDMIMNRNHVSSSLLLNPVLLRGLNCIQHYGIFGTLTVFVCLSIFISCSFF
jgi:hypothetical protein